MIFLWKKIPYWLRGGVIGGGITLVFVFLLYTCTWVTLPGGFVCLPFLFISPLFPFAYLFDVNVYFHSLPPFSMEIIAIITWFFAGAFIGILVGFIKSKKKDV